MIRKQSNILILDTETTGDFSCPLIYDFGYIIKDKNFNELVRRNWLIKEIWETEFFMKSAFYYSKKGLYEEMVQNGEIEILSIREIVKIWLNDIRKYKVKTLSAYNLAFDDRAITKTIKICASDMLEKVQTVFENKNLLCVWNLACDSFMQSEEYKNFCTENGFVTECGNFKTSAEIAKRFIIQSTDYIESHTALSDCVDEFEILEYICNNCNGKMVYGLQFSPWRKVGKVTQG